MSPINSVLIVLVFLATVALYSVDADCVSEWAGYKTKFGKQFSDDVEDNRRCRLFAARLLKINAHNQKNLTWRMGVNHLTYWTDEEINKLSGARVEPSTQAILRNSNTSSRTRRQSPPSSLDLSTTAGVGPIRDQGQCGDCWAFSSCAAMEYAYWKKTGYSGDLSEQQLLDCVYGSAGGCNGGWMPTAFDYVANHQGIAWESTYPAYTAASYGSCRSPYSSPNSVWLHLPQDYVHVASDDNSIKTALYNYGVLSVCVDDTNWYTYSSGIFVFSTSGASPVCRHAVALVGYGVSNSIPYWKIRNSWNPWWGEQGYIRVDARRASNGNTFGGVMLNLAFYPIIY